MAIIDKLKEVNKNFPTGTGTVPPVKPKKFTTPDNYKIPDSALSVKPQNSGKFNPQNASSFVD